METIQSVLTRVVDELQPGGDKTSEKPVVLSLSGVLVNPESPEGQEAIKAGAKPDILQCKHPVVVDPETGEESISGICL